jgi:kynurenine formamidase
MRRATFEIRRIDLVANTGTYLDTPAHRFPGRADLSGIELERVVDLDGVLIDCRRREDPAIDLEAFAGVAVAGRAVLVATASDGAEVGLVKLDDGGARR